VVVLSGPGRNRRERTLLACHQLGDNRGGQDGG